MEQEQSTAPVRRTRTHVAQAKEISQYVKSYWLSFGYSPSLRDIAKHMHLNKTTVYHRLVNMREAGEIYFDSNVLRSYRLPGQRVVFEEKE